MRSILMIAGAAAIAVSMPALAKEKGGGQGGGKPAKHESRGGGNPHRFAARGGGNPHKAEDRGNGNGKAARHFAKADKQHKAVERVARAERKQFKAETKRVERLARSDDRFERRIRDVRRVRDDSRFRDDRRVRDDSRFRDDRTRFAGDVGFGCPPGLARKNNDCLPPGQAKKLFEPRRVFRAGQVVPMTYFSGYNLPDEYQSWYRDTPDTYYRYDDSGYIYQVDRGSNLVESLIPLLGGGFGVGQLLPAGYDTYNLPMAYRDDYIDSSDAYYRYGDDAIYQVDPQTNMIESIVALLGGGLNVGGLLPSGYDTYNLPMEYRDDYVDDADSMYRYADGNIYEIDPQSMIIEQIVASLV